MTTPDKPTSAMVLAAGFGTRMRPLTDTIPKPLVVLAGRPLIDHVLDRLADAGITRTVVNVHHHADKLEAHLKARTRPEIVISDERDAILDTGGGVARALAHFGGSSFVIHNSDSVWIEGIGRNLDRLLDAWNAARMDALMLVAPMTSSIGYDGSGDFHMDSDGRLSRQTGGRMAPFVFAGVSIAHPRLFNKHTSGKFSLNAPWNSAIERGRLYGIRLDGLWMHVGTPQSLADAEDKLAEDRLITIRPGARP
ncbi:MAG: nucleotidyltransferase family protein [Hyphomicrobium sp.]